MRHSENVATLVLLTALGCSAQAPLKTLHSGNNQRVESNTAGEGMQPTTELRADFDVRLTKADGSQHGELWLEVEAHPVAGPAASVTLRIPLATTTDAYGESRACKQGPHNTFAPVFEAGLDEKNYVPFASSVTTKHFSFLLNKYLCRALAAPFRCDGAPLQLPADWKNWRIGRLSTITLTSAAPATVKVSPIAITATLTPFDAAQCEAIAPSNGMCCVQHKTTEWHCGGAPAGPGWHQVSGECFHRETGGTCSE